MLLTPEGRDATLCSKSHDLVTVRGAPAGASVGNGCLTGGSRHRLISDALAGARKVKAKIDQGSGGATT